MGFDRRAYALFCLVLQQVANLSEKLLLIAWFWCLRCLWLLIDASQKYEMNFLDNDLQQTYVEEFRFISQVKFFAIICIIITVIGVFSLTMFETEYRRKEIGIRKVMGSSVGSIVRLFAMRYTVPLVVSFAVAAPVGWWLSMQWLQSFAEHTPLHWWLFPLSFVGVSAVVIATVVAQSWRVATQNPVESIKTE